MSFQIEHNILKKYIEEEGVTEVSIPDGVTEIGERAFEDCKHLTSIHIPNGVTKIAEFAFLGCKTLTNVRIPDSVTEIERFAFTGCEHLPNVYLPDSITIIGNCAFFDCENLTDIHLPDSVTEIGDYAFRRCKHLTSIHIPDNIEFIGLVAFSDCTDVFINIPVSENGEKVRISLVLEKMWMDDSLIDQINMLRTKNFSVDMRKTETKYLLLCRFLVLCPEMPELVAYMKEHFEEIFTFAIQHNFTEAILILIGWNLLNQGNIDDFIRLAIENTQKIGNPEIQLALTEYKYKHIKFTSIEDKFKL